MAKCHGRSYMSYNTTVQKRLNKTNYLRYWNGTTTFTTAPITWNSTRQGSSVPKYKALIANDQNASSSFMRNDVAAKRVGRFGGLISFKMSGVVKTESVDDSMFNELPDTQYIDSSELLSLAQGRFLANATQLTSPLMGGVLVAEARKSLEMIESRTHKLAEDITRYLNTANRLGRKYARSWEKNSAALRRITKDLSDAWLEKTFGWDNLLSDVKTAAETLARWTDAHTPVRCFGGASDTSNGGSKSSYFLGASYHYGILVKKINRSSQARVVGKIRPILDANYGGLKHLAVLTGFSAESFLPSVWELIPYSWAVDYFSNVSSILHYPNAITMPWVYATQSTKTAVTLKSAVSYDVAKIRSILGSNFVSAVEMTSKPSHWERFVYTRSSYDLLPPVPTLRIPGFKQSVNLLAVLGQRIL